MATMRFEFPYVYLSDDPTGRYRVVKRDTREGPRFRVEREMHKHGEVVLMAHDPRPHGLYGRSGYIRLNADEYGAGDTYDVTVWEKDPGFAEEEYNYGSSGKKISTEKEANDYCYRMSRPLEPEKVIAEYPRTAVPDTPTLPEVQQQRCSVDLGERRRPLSLLRKILYVLVYWKLP